MGRNEKTNFDFFRLETSFFSNKKIKSLRRLYGPIGLSTYLYLLCYVYGNDGYYMQFSSIDDLSFDIAEAIAGDNVGKVARRVAECINYLADSDLIDKGYLAEGIITSVSMQGQYIAMCRASKRVIKLEKFRLIDESVVTIEKKPISSEEKGIYSEKMAINSEEMQQIRIDKSREEYMERDREVQGVTPTLEEVKAYAIEINVCIDAQRFVDYYTANGWTINGKPIRDWKAVVTKWGMSKKVNTPYRKPVNPFLNLLKSEGEK